MKSPLEGMKILDFTYLLPGPFGTMTLADMGADIIKVENPRNPDMMRLVPPLVGDVSAAYAHVNRGKRSLALDLKADGAREILFRLARDYDILIEQFRPGVMEKLGLGYDDLRGVNPSIIYCSLSGYGQTGRYAQRAGHDINYLALSGVESFSGCGERGPTLHGIQLADIAGGSKNLVIAVLAAFIKRLRTGEGDYIDISITDGVFSLSVFDAAGYLAGGREPAREEEILNGGSLYDFYRTADGGYLSAGPIEPKFLTAFCEALGLGDELAKGLLSNEEVRALKARIAERIASYPLDHWTGVFREVDACVEPVRSLGDAISAPPLSERDMIITVANEDGTKFRQIANPIKFASGSFNAAFAGARLGYHTDAVLAETGFDRAEIASLRGRGVVA